MNNHNCNTCGGADACHKSTAKTAFKNTTAKSSCDKKAECAQSYGYYSRVLNKPFDTVEELYAAEEAYYKELRLKEEAAAAKSADAQKVDAAFKALNTARKSYKEDITQLTKEYAEALENLKKAFELGKKDIRGKLAAAEDTYQAALKEYADKHPEGYRLVLRDGDFETTINSNTSDKKADDGIMSLFDMLFGTI